MNNMRVIKTHGHQDPMSAVASQRFKTCDLRPATRKMIIAALLIFAVAWLILPQTSQAATTSQISQFGITWTFDREYEYGTFANGDYWVVGPLTIIAIDPPSTKDPTTDRIINGSMLDPSLGQGFDSLHGGYNASLNVARPNGNDLSAENPLVISAGHSLVSAVSWIVGEPGCPTLIGGVPRPVLKDASVLTILASAPDVNSFRPAYADPNKTIKFNVNDINYEVFSDLPPTPSVHSLATVEGWFERVWLDWIYVDQYIKPSNNMPNYGREICKQTGDAALVLNCNYTDAQKETAVIRYVQLGIDLYGILTNSTGTMWVGNGGYSAGRKLPILVAGVVLNDADMKGISNNYHFGEDDQTFYVSASDVYTPPYLMRHRSVSGQPGSERGNVKVVQGSNIVEGIGTEWLGISNPQGRTLYFGIDNDPLEAYKTTGQAAYVVESIDSNTQITLTEAYRADTNETGNSTYVISTFVFYGHGDPYVTGYADWDEFTNEHLGLPGFGLSYYPNTWIAGVNWTTSYQVTASTSFCSGALPAHIMGLKTLWNENAFFDYTDRWMQIEEGSSRRSLSDFAEEMWDTYRADYGCIWTRDDPTDIYSNGFNPCALEIIGDVNADGEVTAFDAALAAHIAVDLEHPEIKNRAAAEVSGDAEVTAYDAALIAQRAVGLIERFPVE